jgi:TPR repeat protein
MVQRTRWGRSQDPDYESFDEDVGSDRATPYRFGRSARDDYPADEPAPLFLSDYDEEEPDPGEFINPLRKKKASISFRILLGVSAAAALAMLFALFSSDDMRAILTDAKVSIAAILPGPSAAAQPNTAQLTPRDLQLKDPAPSKDSTRLAGPVVQPAGGVRSPVTVAMAPSRDDITTAYQSALQNQAPAAAPPVIAAAVAAPAPAAKPVAPTAPATLMAVATPTAPLSTAAPARTLDAQELATLMKRAKGLLAAGDISPARLLLERAAEAQDATAALMLAQTYDPAVLGRLDTRNINTDPAAARTWYQRAAQLGSTDAQRRLAQMQN